MAEEPSMEEILASIKRVIADDSRQPGGGQRGTRPRSSQRGPAPAPDPEHEEAEEEEDVLELDQPLRDDDGLISADRAAASRESLAQLAALRRQDDPGPVDQAPLEAVVRDMLRPMLKQWLEDRLPDLVEEMVAREISRITGKKF